MADPDGERLTRWQRMALRSLAKQARKPKGEPLSEEDWGAFLRFNAQPRSRAVKAVLRALPSTPRCGFCGAPFAGFGRRLVAPLGYTPSRKNPNVCSSCVELAPPGGMTVEVGVLFADLRGFTASSEHLTPAQATAVLQRFYAHAEKALLPEALIDKLIGDEVMALYVPTIMGLDGADPAVAQRRVATVMVEHARDLLERVGYGSGRGPEVEVGIGLDLGEAFVGNVGNQAVHDFTAIGDVVNTASRLQGEAAGGEVVLSARLATHLEAPVGEPEQLTLKGKAAPLAARRIRWFG